MHLNSKLCQLVLCLIWLNSPVLVRLWDAEFNRNYLCELGMLLQVQELIWFVSQQLNTTNSAGLQHLIISVGKCLGVTQTILSNYTGKRVIQTENKENSLSVVLTTSTEDPILHVYGELIRGRHYTFGLLIMVNAVDDFKVVEQFLLDLNTRRLQNTLLYYYTPNRTNELFGAELFPERRFVNRSNYIEYLQNTLGEILAGGTGMYGYKLYTPLRQDLPHVFSYVNAGGQTVWQGSTYMLLKLFMDYSNGTLVGYEMPKDRLGGDVVDMKAVLELIRQREVPVSAHAYALFQTDDNIGKSYPIMVVRWCLMVPVWNSITTIYYLTEPLDEWTWLGILGVFGVLVVCRCLWHCCQGTQQLAARLSDSILYCFCLSTGIATHRIIRAPSAVYFLIYATIFFYGFFLTAIYNSQLGSIFTVTLFRAQINTMDDLIRNNLSVMIIDYELDFLLSNDNELPENFTRLILPVDVATFDKHQVQLNSSFAYFVTEEKWHFLQLQQRYLKQGIFKFTDICFGSYHLAYPLTTNSLMHRNVEYYIYRTYSSGLLGHYERSAFDYAVQAGLVKRLADTSDGTLAGMQHLYVVFVVMLAIFCVSFIVFAAELLIYRATRKRS